MKVILMFMELCKTKIMVQNTQEVKHERFLIYKRENNVQVLGIYYLEV